MRHRGQSSDRRSEHGFTLVELTVVLVLIASVVLAVLPNMRTMARRNRVADASRQVQAALQLARMRSINEGTDYVVQFTPNGWNIYNDLDQDGVRDGNEKWVHVTPILLPPGVTYSLPADTLAQSLEIPQLATSGCKCARWQPNGTMRLSTSTVTNLAVSVGNGSDYRQLGLSVAGAQKLQRWNAEAHRWE